MKVSSFIFFIPIIFLTGCGDSKQKKETPQAPSVEVAHPGFRTVVYTFEYPGYMEAEQTVNLVARVSGYLDSYNFTPGQRVREGQTLFVIEPQPYKDKVAQAEANVESCKSKLAYAKASYERMKEAVKNKAISEIDYLQSQSDYGEAVAAYEDARAQLSSANIDLSYCMVKAPFTGRISRNMVDPGNMVGTDANNSALATIYKDNHMYLYFNMAYADFMQLPQNSPSALPVTIQDVNNPEKTWIASLDYRSPNVDLSTGTITVRAIARNPNGDLLSGMYVKVVVPYKSVPKAIVIPEASISTNQGGRYIYLVTPDDTVEFRQVKVGTLTPDGMREIISGVTTENRYVTKALINIRPGMKIKPILKF